MASTPNSFFLTKKYIKILVSFLTHFRFSKIASNRLYSLLIFSSSGSTSTVLPTFFVGGSIFSIFCSVSIITSYFLGSTLISVTSGIVYIFYCYCYCCIVARLSISLSDIFIKQKIYRNYYSFFTDVCDLFSK